MKQKLITILSSVGAGIVTGIIFGLMIGMAIFSSGCASNEIITVQKQNIPVKVQLDTLTYHKVMQPPKIFFVETITEDGLLEYTIDLQNKYLLLRNTFYNTIEGQRLQPKKLNNIK